MTLIDQSLHSVLVSDAGVSAIVAARVYPLELPQEPTLPAIVYFKISSSRLTHHGTTSKYCEANYQISCVAATVLGAKLLAAAVVSAVHGYSGTVDSLRIFVCEVISESDLLQTAIEEYAVAIDVSLKHLEA